MIKSHPLIKKYVETFMSKTYQFKRQCTKLSLLLFLQKIELLN